jgi:hypothetical protein
VNRQGLGPAESWAVNPTRAAPAPLLLLASRDRAQQQPGRRREAERNNRLVAADRGREVSMRLSGMVLHGAAHRGWPVTPPAPCVGASDFITPTRTNDAARCTTYALRPRARGWKPRTQTRASSVPSATPSEPRGPSEHPSARFYSCGWVWGLSCCRARADFALVAANHQYKSVSIELAGIQRTVLSIDVENKASSGRRLVITDVTTYSRSALKIKQTQEDDSP